MGLMLLVRTANGKKQAARAGKLLVHHTWYRWLNASVTPAPTARSEFTRRFRKYQATDPIRRA
ncbi:hypothetical protein D3C86_2021870 [compost metagenome]